MRDVMATIRRSTEVTFPGNAVHGTSALVAVVPAGGRWGVVTESTPFHPVDHTWPDHPADLGVLTLGPAGHPVADCVIGAVDAAAGDVLLGEDIPVRRDAEGWHWLVVHIVDEPPDARPGAEVGLTVDRARRDGLSAGHTACELVTLAVNAALADRWRKQPPTDVLGNPDFDGVAITGSRIGAYGSRDTYRLNKSLRRKGFVTDGLAADLPAVEDRVNALMAGWVGQRARVWVDASGPELTAFRTWNCALAEGTVTVPCGGTHVTNTAELGTVSVRLTLSEDGGELTMDTEVSPAG